MPRERGPAGARSVRRERGPIEARSDGTLWARFFATPNGDHVLVSGSGGKLVPLEEWRRTIR